MNGLRNGPDRDLIGRCLSGDPQAWDAFARAYGPLLLEKTRFALRRFGAAADETVAHDLAQEIFRTLMDNDAAVLRSFRWNCSLTHYLSVIVLSRVANHLRRGSRVRPARIDTLEEEDWERLSPDEPSTGRLEKSERAGRLRDALSRLSARERLALQLHYWDRRSLEEIAHLFSVRADAVGMLLSRARQRLKDLMKKHLCL